MDRIILYNIVYALAAKDDRESALFGNCSDAAREAFSRSLAGEAFPELWFELPLAHHPWLDFHSLVSYEDVANTQATFSGQGGVYADALSWFAAQQPRTVRQLALSYDTSTGNIENPAVQLLVSGTNIAVPLGFLEAAGRPDAKEPYRTFVENIPEEWFACYVGVFPGRESIGTPRWVRVECIVNDELQRAYANDADLLTEHLERVGLTSVSSEAIDAILMLARSPFPLELQFNVGPDGMALPCISASVRFFNTDWNDESRIAEIGGLMERVQERGLADERWKRLAGATFAKRVSRGESSMVFACFPAFVKLRWREGKDLDAKTYLIAYAQ